MYKNIIKENSIIIRSPPRELLLIFGGTLSIEDFRKNSFFYKKEYKLLLPPFKSIFHIIEEDHRSFTKNEAKNNIFVPLNKKDVSKAQLVLKLKRNIPLQKKHICKQCSLEKQTGDGNPFYNKQHSSNSINKISNSRIGKYCGKDNHMFNNPFYKKIISDKAIERWNNGSMEETRVKLRNLMKNRIASGELKSYNRSKAEDELIKILNQNNIDIIPNFLLCGKIFDIYIPFFNLLIEYNGDYWHCNPNKYDENYINVKKNKTAKEIWEYDKNKLYLAKNNGYNCEVIWESDYKKNKNIIIELIKIYENK
jgi:hypothetical protein